MGRSIKRVKQLPLVEVCIVFTWFLVMMYLFIGYLIPTSFWLEQRGYALFDMCVGDQQQLIAQERTPRWYMRGTSFDQLVIFEGQQVIETTIYRGTKSNPNEFAYEGDDRASYWIKWSEPVSQEGKYGAYFHTTINPLPFIYKDILVEPTKTMFNVVECN